MRRWSTEASGSLAIHEVSPPEQKAEPSPVTTTARSERSAASSSTAATQDAVISSDIALRWSGVVEDEQGDALGRALDAQVGGRGTGVGVASGMPATY